MSKTFSICLLTTAFVALLEEESLHRRNVKSLRSAIMARSRCPIELMRKVIDVMGYRGITIAYGQTETAPVLTQSSLTDSIEVRVQTVGGPLPGVEIRIADAASVKDLPDGQRGEL